MNDIHRTAARPFHFETVRWDDARATELRRVMDVEVSARYAARMPTDVSPEVIAVLAVHPEDVAATVLVIDEDGTPIGHAVLRMLRGEWEVKRVVVADGQRGRGVGRALMAELERIAREAGAARLILQTGDLQPDAVALYTRIGYTPIPIYEPYVTAIPFSLCFEKVLR
ncbi:MAG: acetyltransferase [Glaciihabitans sp.]|nr:acetyltransferase [Glaciihabitans sp.]